MKLKPFDSVPSWEILDCIRSIYEDLEWVAENADRISYLHRTQELTEIGAQLLGFFEEEVQE